MAEYGITDGGFTIKTAATILQELKASVNAKYKQIAPDKEIYLGTDGIIGQFLAATAEEQAKQWESLQTVYAAQFVSLAEGTNLDRASRGIQRRNEIKATVTLTIGGPEHTIIAQGTSVRTENNIFFNTIERGEIGAGQNSVTVSAQAAQAGRSGNVSNGAIAFFVVARTGLTVTNENAAFGGADRETDAEFRKRILETQDIGRSSSIGDIEQGLLSVPDVTYARVFVNNNRGLVDEDIKKLEQYALAGTVEAVVQGGEDTAIAQHLYENIAAGIATVGTKTIELTTNYGQQNIYFSRPVEIKVFIVVRITLESETELKKSGRSRSDFDTDSKNIAIETIRQRFYEYVGGDYIKDGEIYATYTGLEIGKGLPYFLVDRLIYELGESPILSEFQDYIKTIRAGIATDLSDAELAAIHNIGSAAGQGIKVSQTQKLILDTNNGVKVEFA